MPESFSSDYAAYYDIIYQDKDYDVECDFVEQIWRRFSPEKPRTLLDLGCGTGGHAIPLAIRGYRVTGVDVSSAMIALARQKAQLQNLQVAFHISAMEGMELQQKFDTAVCMFNTINYVVEDVALQKTLSNIRRHLLPGGLFLFDFRNGVPSLRSYSPTNVKWMNRKNLRILRLSETKLDAIEQLFYTTYTCLIFDGDRLIKEFRDEHVVRFHFLPEIRHYLREAGFEIIHTCPFLALNGRLTEKDWNITVVARAI